MPNPYVNKVQKADGTVIIDISDTTAVAADVASGKYFYTAAGEKVAGTHSGGTAAISVEDTADSHGGTVRTITALDISDTTAVAADVAQGKYFYTADGTKTAGTASGGGGGGATQHTIHFEFSDSTDTDIDVYYDDVLLGTMITAYEPTTYGGKTVTLAQLDGVTWYEPSVIPLNTQLIDYTKVSSNKAIDSDGSEITQQWYYVSDYTAVERGMTFSYTAGIWTYIGFYNSSKVALDTIYVYSDGTVDPSDSNIAHGTLSGNKLPLGVAYVRIASTGDNSSRMSLIRTA